MQVTTVDAHYQTWHHLIKGVKEANVAAATTREILCKMKSDLAGLGKKGGEEWFMDAAVEAHEGAHVAQWKGSLDSRFGTFNSAVEGLSVPHRCGQTPQDGKDAIKNLQEYKQAEYAFIREAFTEWVATGHINADTAAAVSGVVNPMIDSLEAKRQQNGWAVCN